jgi:hypothetical protein
MGGAGKLVSALGPVGLAVRIGISPAVLKRALPGISRACATVRDQQQVSTSSKRIRSRGALERMGVTSQKLELDMPLVPKKLRTVCLRD